MDRETELALVDRLRAGDLAAFDAIYEAYRARLYGFLVRLSRRPDVAEDLLEETWLRLVSHARALSADTRLAAWLFTVARNLYWSYCRSRLLEEERTAPLMSVAMPDRGPSPFESAAAGELERRVERALAALPRTLREALLLVGVEGFTPAEAAGVCGIRADALRQRLARARAMVAAALDANERLGGTGPPEVRR